MTYQHGITIRENGTPLIPPKKSGTLQVVVGTSPVNLASDPKVNEPVLLFELSEAIEKLGYGADYKKFSLCQSMDATFKLMKVAPIVMINVLDPEKHKTVVASKSVPVASLAVKEKVEGILKDTVVVKNEAASKTYVLDTDYTLSFDSDGYLDIKVVADGAAKDEVTLKINYTKLDPSAVTADDIVGAYTQVTNKYTGIQAIKQIYPRFGLVPSILLAPGYSHNPEVARALEAMRVNLNGSFSATVLNDLDASSKDYTAAPTWKNVNGYTADRTIALFPKLKIGEKIYAYSALLGAVMARMDAENDDVPCKSPSSRALPITAAVFDDGEELFLDRDQANFLNSHGIVTAINEGGWKVWGNNTAAYPGTTDPKERFILTRRMFDYVGNTFVTSYAQKVDNPTDYRLIESVVDSENMRLNSLQAGGKIVSGRIEFITANNPITQILDGKIVFNTYLAGAVPAKEIVNVLEFDPNAYSKSLGGN